jgi:RND family efflux transporter MFP subunit
MGVGSWAQTTPFLGKVVALPDMVADVICPATGQILPAGERAYTVGDRVRKGDPLVVIANRYNLHDASHISNTRWDFWQQMMEARYAALEARVARERAERLKAAGSATGQQVAELRAAEQTAQANFLKRQNLLAQQDEQIAGTTLENRPVAAPIDGQISVANFTHGQMVYEELQLFRIVNLKQVGVAVRVPEASFQPWPVGTVARVRFDDLPGRAFTGKLEQISPVVDPQTRAREVQFRVENPDELLRFGMIGQVEVQVP